MVNYEELADAIAAASENVNYAVSVLANASALIYDAVDGLNWCGFYIVNNGKLLLGPFQGKVACTEIEFGKGVCGTAAAKDETVAVSDVHTFDGHIACDSASNSEIVVPVHKNGKLYGVLDLDSTEFSRFTQEDKAGLELAAKSIEEALNRI